MSQPTLYILLPMFCIQLVNCMFSSESFVSWQNQFVHGSYRAATTADIEPGIDADDRSDFAVIIDAGKNASQVHVYRWQLEPGGRIEHTVIYHVRPTLRIPLGLADVAKKLTDVREMIIRPLVINASGIVPRWRHSKTPIYVFATAGIRLLPEKRIQSLMTFIDGILRDRLFNPFSYSQSHAARVLSGEEEGVFSWIAVNYAAGAFEGYGGGHPLSTVGILELGDISVQITFSTTGNVLDNMFPVRISGSRFSLYSHSYLYYGQEDAGNAVKRTIKQDAANTNSDQRLNDPCMMKGDSETVEALNRTYFGTGETVACRRVLETFLFKGQCSPEPCALGIYQPTPLSSMAFYAVGAFKHTLNTIRALDTAGVYVPEYGLKKADEFCLQSLDEMRQSAGTNYDDQHDRRKCLRSQYIYLLITQGFGFAANSSQIHVVDNLNGHSLGWPLGAVIYENIVQECQLANSAVRILLLSGFNRVWLTVIAVLAIAGRPI